jgi:hypothetical protein
VPQTREEIDHDRGPVLVKIEYRIDPKNSAGFVRALDELGSSVAAMARSLGESSRTPVISAAMKRPTSFESWLELMHLRERVTNADRVLEDEIREMLIAPPRIEFLIAAERGDEARHRRAEPAGA